MVFIFGRACRKYATASLNPKYTPIKRTTELTSSTVKDSVVPKESFTNNTTVASATTDAKAVEVSSSEKSPAFLTTINRIIPIIENIDWTSSYHGIASSSFSKEAIEILLAPIDPEDIEMLTENNGLLYLPEIKYRRILNKAFGPGSWGLVPRSPHSIFDNKLTSSPVVKDDHMLLRGDPLFSASCQPSSSTPKVLSREYALIVNQKFVSAARGEQIFFNNDGIPTAVEGVKSNALMRCCKDLGIASELWDPTFIRDWKLKWCTEVWAIDVRTKSKKKVWKKKGTKLPYPFQE